VDRLSLFGLFIPKEALIFLIMGAGFALMFGQKNIAKWLMLLALTLAILPPFLEPIFSIMPNWIFILILVLLAFSMFRSLVVLLTGKEATDHMVGSLTADVVRFLFLAPFKMIRGLIRWLVNLFRH